MDRATFFGLIIGIGGILAGNYLDGGQLASVVQGTAFLIVITGTMGAVLVSNRSHDIWLGLKLFQNAFKKQNLDYEATIKEIIEFAKIARKESTFALEPKLDEVQSVWLKNVLISVVDGTDPQLTRQIFENIIIEEENRLMRAGKIWNDAGGFSPTIGIIGAVLGLIHVMGNLADSSKLGSGIAVAFVATIYGVGFANLVFIPIGNKIKKNILDISRFKYMILEGVLLIGTPLNSHLIEQKLLSYQTHKLY